MAGAEALSVEARLGRSTQCWAQAGTWSSIMRRRGDGKPSSAFLNMGAASCCVCRAIRAAGFGAFGVAVLGGLVSGGRRNNNDLKIHGRQKAGVNRARNVTYGIKPSGTLTGAGNNFS